MKKIGLNRTALKWLALVTMLIDHVGAVLGEEFFSIHGVPWLYSMLRCVGRLAFPIFAFFIAEGWHYTRSRKRYFLFMLLFAVISQPIYYFALNRNLFDLNIFFTFVVALAVLYLIDNVRQKDFAFVYIAFIAIVVILVAMLTMVGVLVDYGVYGVILPAVFYLFYHSEKKWAKPVMFALAGLFIIINWLGYFVYLTEIDFNNFIELFAIFSLPLLAIYNGEKGKRSFKWLFYIFYPAHILVLYLISLLII